MDSNLEVDFARGQQSGFDGERQGFADNLKRCVFAQSDARVIGERREQRGKVSRVDAEDGRHIAAGDLVERIEERGVLGGKFPRAVFG